MVDPLVREGDRMVEVLVSLIETSPAFTAARFEGICCRRPTPLSALPLQVTRGPPPFSTDYPHMSRAGAFPRPGRPFA